MATRNKLKTADIRRIVRLANEGGQKAAAAEFGCSQAAISNLLKANGYKPRIVYMREKDAS